MAGNTITDTMTSAIAEGWVLSADIPQDSPMRPYINSLERKGEIRLRYVEIGKRSFKMYHTDDLADIANADGLLAGVAARAVQKVFSTEGAVFAE